ncbi:MAG: CoA-binding protein [Bacteroidales bacterium]|nr:CoA-binding protein [Bacteroidales bacterium]
MNKPTLVIGASTNPDRYSYMAIRSLVIHHFKVYALGLREGKVHGISISRPFPQIPEIHTVTMYVGKRNQPFYYDYIVSLKPKRIIFNPGSENKELERMMTDAGTEVMHACTLVMLAQGGY